MVGAPPPFERMKLENSCLEAKLRMAMQIAFVPSRTHEATPIGRQRWNLKWGPSRSNRLALWRGRVPMLGAENVLRTRPRFQVPLTVHENALGWLRADRDGIVIIDHRRAADWHDGFTLATATAAHGEQLRQKLTRPAPPIITRRAPL
jgi:hypothetical protein